MQGYLVSRPQLERGALGSAVIAGGVKNEVVRDLGFVGTEAFQKQHWRTGSHICRSAGGGHRGPQRLWITGLAGEIEP